MTPQEAIDFIEHEVQIDVRFCSDEEVDKTIEVFEFAISALKKQMPKKPQYVDTRFRHHGRKISDGSSLDKCYKCPNCNSHIFHVFDSEKCCKYCGQALDWSENNA